MNAELEWLHGVFVNLSSCSFLQGCDVHQCSGQSFASQIPQGKCVIPVLMCLLRKFHLVFAVI